MPDIDESAPSRPNGWGRRPSVAHSATAAGWTPITRRFCQGHYVRPDRCPAGGSTPLSPSGDPVRNTLAAIAPLSPHDWPHHRCTGIRRTPAGSGKMSGTRLAAERSQRRWWNGSLDLRCNPTHWRIRDFFDDGRDSTAWTIRRHRDDISAGDDVAIWLSGRRSGVAALGKVTGGLSSARYRPTTRVTGPSHMNENTTVGRSPCALPSTSWMIRSLVLNSWLMTDSRTR
jgi:hypothetical protein